MSNVHSAPARTRQARAGAYAHRKRYAQAHWPEGQRAAGRGQRRFGVLPTQDAKPRTHAVSCVCAPPKRAAPLSYDRGANRQRAGQGQLAGSAE